VEESVPGAEGYYDDGWSDEVPGGCVSRDRRVHMGSETKNIQIQTALKKRVYQRS